MLSLIVEKALAQFEACPKALETNTNYHLVVKELRDAAMEIGYCCGRTRYSHSGGGSYTRSSSRSSYSLSRDTRDGKGGKEFWDKLAQTVNAEAKDVGKGPIRRRKGKKSSRESIPAAVATVDPPKK